MQPTQDDRRLAASALEKRRSGTKPNAAEAAALKRCERERSDAQRLEAYRSVRKREWRQWSGRQDKTLNEQAVRYGVPIGESTIDLPQVVRWLHDFLAANKLRLSAGESEDPLLAGANSPALERYRLARAKREEFSLERDLGQWLPRDKAHEAIGMFADIIRRACETLQRKYGPGAHQILERAVNNAANAYASHFNDLQPGNAHVDPGDSAEPIA